MIQEMNIVFNALGVVEEVTGNSVRQGTVGKELVVTFDDDVNTDHIAKFNLTRPNGTHIDNVLLTPDTEDEKVFRFTFADLWYFALDGEATITIYLYDANNNIDAQGQAIIYVEETDYHPGSETITEEQYNTLLAQVVSKLAKNSHFYLKVVDNISNINSNDYEGYLSAGDLVYSKYNKKFYRLSGTHPSLTYAEETLNLNGLIVNELEIDNELYLDSGFDSIVDDENVTLPQYIGNRMAYIFVKGSGTIQLTDAQYNLLANNDNIQILYDNKIYTKTEKNAQSGHHDIYVCAGTFVFGLNTTNYELKRYTINLYHGNKTLSGTIFGYTFYSKEKIDELLNNKADKSTTYTKTEVDDALGYKANASDVYPKSDTYNKTEVYTKGETDTAIANAIATVYKPQGTKTVAQLNALTPTSAYNGYVYNVSDDGTLSQGSVSVSAGDNVVLLWDSVNNTWSWDKLSSTVDLTPYYTKTEVDNLLGGKVAKSSETNVIYGRTTTEAVFQVGQGANANKIVQRTSTGQINVPETPTADEHAPSKKYVDLGLAGKVPTSRTIAGIDLADDITAQELLTGLGLEFTDVTVTEVD